jgi:NAD(P)-dependent dehydrogenase (short-subunit alcohol dehydrogenase family)
MTGSNSIALVTGASRGLGRVIAGVLATRGYRLVIGARDRDALALAAHELAQDASTVVPVAGDITEAPVRATLVDAARRCGGLHVLVNNVGAWTNRPARAI